MKKTISLMLVLLMLAVSCLPVSAGTQEQTVISAATKNAVIHYTGEDTDSFRVAVNLSLGKNESGIAAYTVTVSWNPEVLELVTNYDPQKQQTKVTGCYFTDAFSEGWEMIPDGSTVVNFKNITDGQITVSSAGATNRSKSDGTLFLLEFRPKNINADTEIIVSLGSKNISATAALSSASGRITNVTPETSLSLQVRGDYAVLLGDLDGNGKVEAKDYMMLKRHVLGTYQLTDTQKVAADVNLDGKTDAKDYMMVKRHVLGTYTIPS